MNKIEKLKKFLQENFPNIQAFNTRSVAGDYMKELAKLIGKYCSWCEATNYKKNKAKCYKYSKRFLNKKLRRKYKPAIKS